MGRVVHKNETAEVWKPTGEYYDDDGYFYTAFFPLCNQRGKTKKSFSKSKVTCKQCLKKMKPESQRG